MFVQAPNFKNLFKVRRNFENLFKSEHIILVRDNLVLNCWIEGLTKSLESKTNISLFWPILGIQNEHIIVLINPRDSKRTYHCFGQSQGFKTNMVMQVRSTDPLVISCVIRCDLRGLYKIVFETISFWIFLQKKRTGAFLRMLERSWTF